MLLGRKFRERLGGLLSVARFRRRGDGFIVFAAGQGEAFAGGVLHAQHEISAGPRLREFLPQCRNQILSFVAALFRLSDPGCATNSTQARTR